MEPKLLDVSLQGPDVGALVSAVVNTWFSQLELPHEVEIDHEVQPVTQEWLAKWLGANTRRGLPKLTVSFDETYTKRISVGTDGIVKVSVPGELKTVEQVTFDLEHLPFELAVFGSIYPEWYSWDDPYRPPVGGEWYGGHYPLGWAAAFRGQGHRRLVSRRWLDYGPWRLVHGQGDITLVQFHDLETTDSQARIQAAPGHALLGYSPHGGIIPHVPTYDHPIDGLYVSGERRLKVIIHGRLVPESEMLSACTARYYQALGPNKPLEHVAYVFMQEHDALAHVQALWLRELECYCIVAGQEVRLDTTFTPPTPVVVSW